MDDDEAPFDTEASGDDGSGDPPGLVRVPGFPPTVSPVDDPELRGNDGSPYGTGSFGGSRDDGARGHAGIDVVTVPGKPVKSIVGGRVTLFDPYGRDPNKAGKLHAAQIQVDPDTTDSDKRYTVRQLYIDTSGLKNGQRVEPGQVLGPAEDLETVYPPRSNGVFMTNHMHIDMQPGSVYRLGRPDLNLDPTPLLEAWQKQRHRRQGRTSASNTPPHHEGQRRQCSCHDGEPAAGHRL
jgi:hypothetical protein